MIEIEPPFSWAVANGQMTILYDGYDAPAGGAGAEPPGPDAGTVASGAVG